MVTHSSVLAWRIPGTGSLVGSHLWGRRELDTTEATQQHPLTILSIIPASVDLTSISFFPAPLPLPQLQPSLSLTSIPAMTYVLLLLWPNPIQNLPFVPGAYQVLSTSLPLFVVFTTGEYLAQTSYPINMCQINE